MDADRFAAVLRTLITRPSRRAVLRSLGGLGLAGLLGETRAKKKRKKRKCAKAGQRTRKRRKKCCRGLVKDGSGICVQPASPSCVPRVCPATTCGSVPDGCGGTLTCGCSATQLCIDGVCQTCTVNCTGTPAQCGTALQAAMNGGGTVYVCPGRYQGGFVANAAVRVIGAGRGAAAASNTILDAGGPGRVMTISNGVGLVVLERLRITGADAPSGVNGAGIAHLGTVLRMTECTVSGNTGQDSFGVGINVSANRRLEMLRCTVRDNHATGAQSDAGGIYTVGTTILTDCLVDANSADDLGGGLYVSQGTTTLAGTTQVRLNEAEFGGGIYVGSTATLVIAETCRVTQNTALLAENGGGIYNNGGTVTLQGANPSPIVVNNCHENCVGTVPKCAATPVSC